MTDEITTPEPVETPSAPVELETLESRLSSHMAEQLDKIEARDRMPEKGENGKFVSKNPPAAAPDQATPAAENTDQPATPEGETAKPSIAPPESWSAENKAKFATLPPDVQAYIAQREGEAHKAITQKGEELKRFEPWQQVLQPHRARLAQAGVPEAEYVHRLLNADAALANPATREQAIQHIAQLYGVDLQRLTTGQPAGQQAQPQDPALAALMSEVTRLRSWAETREMQDRQAAQARQDAANRDAEARASAFLNDPKYPYAKELEADMSALILAERRLGRELSLEDAYKKATRANDSVWSKIEAEKAAKAKQEAEAEAAKKAAEARKRTPTIVKPRGSGAVAPSSAASWEARMNEVYDRTQGAA